MGRRSGTKQQNADAGREAAPIPSPQPLQVELIEKPWWRSPQLWVAGVALILSLVLAVIGMIYALKGPEILVREPTEYVLYLDDGVINATFRIDMVNTAAAEHGDALVESSFAIAGAPMSWGVQNSVQFPVVRPGVDANPHCQRGLDCVAHANPNFTFVAVENPYELISLRGGDARTINLAYPIVEWNCEGDEQSCAQRSTSGGVIRTFGSRVTIFRIRLSFHSDGEFVVRCNAGRIDIGFLRRFGWVKKRCIRDRSVTR